MLNTPFPPWPSYSEEEARSVYDLVLSNRVNFWTGNEIKLFEEEFASYTSTKFAVAVTNGSVALDLALHSCLLEPGDEVVVTPRSFIASVSSVVLAGATPVFADVDKNSQNITAESIKRVVTARTKAILVVHLAGMPADMDPIMHLAEESNLTVIEDCAQAHGAKYKGKSVGSLGHLAAWSFCQDKIMTTGGEGGMVTTNSVYHWKAIRSFRDHGKSVDAKASVKHAHQFKWVHDSFGTNARMLEYQAVFGRIQLRKLDQWVDKRRELTRRIHKVASKFSALRVPVEQKNVRSSYYKCYLFVDPHQLNSNFTRDRILLQIVDRGVPCFVGSCPEIYLEKAFDKTEFRPKHRLEVSKELGENSLMFLVHPTLREIDIENTCKALNDVMLLASK